MNSAAMAAALKASLEARALRASAKDDETFARRAEKAGLPNRPTELRARAAEKRRAADARAEFARAMFRNAGVDQPEAKEGA